jgi:hypothetical protein
MEQVNGKAGKTVQTFDEFNASRKARSEAELAEMSEAAERPAKRKRKPAASKETVPPKEASVADLLLQAVRIVNSRRGRVPRDEQVREQILMDILTDAVKGAE